MRSYLIERGDGVPASYSARVMAAVWTPGTPRPAMTVFASGPGSVRTLIATIRMGRTWRVESEGSSTDPWNRNIPWAKTSQPAIYSRTGFVDGRPDHVVTTALFRDQFAVRGRSSPFVIMPGLAQVTPCSPRLIQRVGSWAIDQYLDWSVEAEWFESYADLLATYLSSRSRWPVVLGKACRLATLAVLLSARSAWWQGDRCWPTAFRRSTDDFAALGTRELGFGPALLVDYTERLVQEIVETIPRRVASEFGVRYVAGEDLPPAWRD